MGVGVVCDPLPPLKKTAPLSPCNTRVTRPLPLAPGIRRAEKARNDLGRVLRVALAVGVLAAAAQFRMDFNVTVMTQRHQIAGIEHERTLRRNADG